MKRSPVPLLLTGVLIAAAGAFALAGRPSTEATQPIVTAPVAPVPALVAMVDSLLPGEPVTAVVERMGVATSEAVQMLSDLRHLDPRSVKAGTRVTATIDPLAGVREVVFRLAVDTVVRFRRDSTGWIETQETLPWVTDTVVVGGRIASTLSGALIEGAIAFPRELRVAVAGEIANVFEYRLDLSRDLRVGDTIMALMERKTAPGGHVKVGRVLAAKGILGGGALEAVRFDDANGDTNFYDASGKSLKSAFLRTPLEYSRISSTFGGRRHPILKTFRQHTGVDYAARSGTPVRAIGSGTVIFAGRRGGYGNTIEIRHANGMVTRYAHLRGFAKGISRGARVQVSNTIGYVGSTGLATGPHLHFETLIGGRHQNPSKVLRDVGGEPLPSNLRTAFTRHRLALLGDLDARVYAMQQGGLPTDLPTRLVIPGAAARAGAVGAGN